MWLSDLTTDTGADFAANLVHLVSEEGSTLGDFGFGCVGEADTGCLRLFPLVFENLSGV